MKNTAIAFFAAMLNIASVYGQKTKTVILITRTQSSGDRFSQTIVSADKKSSLDLEQSLNLEAPFTRKYIVDPSTLKNVTDYVIANCDPVDHFDERTNNLFKITIVSKGQEMNCYISEDKPLAKSFFQKLLNLINRPSHKSSNSQFLNYLKAVVRSLK